MVIRSMTATFGCLDGAVLKLKPGWNEIILPNESGKSTWSAFLLAMFYGIDTSERSARGRLPAKTRYQPWSGKAMEGIVELEHRGRTIVLQRTSSRGRPMGQFRAYDKITGLDLPELTGENCGLYFFGVERSVFQRSAFLSGEELTVTEDGALSRRLENLAAAGTAHDNYPAAAETLKQWKNRCRYHQNGLIPEAQRRLRQAEETLTLLADLRQQRLAAAEALIQCQAVQQAKANQDDAQWQNLQNQAAEETAQAHARAEQAAARAAQLPPPDRLQRLLVRLEQQTEPIPPESPCPPALAGLAAENILNKAQRDQSTCTTQLAIAKAHRLPWLIGAVLLAALAVLAARPFGYGALIPAAAAVGLAVCWVLQGRRKTTARAAAAALLTSYGVSSPEELLPVALRRRDWLLTRERVQQQSWETDALLEEIAVFAPGADTVPKAIQALEQGLQSHQTAEQARQALEQACLRQQSLVRPRDEVLEAEKEKATALQLQTETLRSREEALGGLEKQTAKQEQLSREVEMLLNREAALALAQEALTAAHEQLTQVYAPRLTSLAGSYLQKLTDGRYDGLILQQGLQLLARESGGLTRPLAALSRGTQDQAWLALRLAMTRLLLPDDAPVVLDDALTAFDRDRSKAAKGLLAQENRQVLLFGCK